MTVNVSERFGLYIVTPYHDSEDFAMYNDIRISKTNLIVGYWSFGGQNYRDYFVRLSTEAKLLRRRDKVLIFKIIKK